MKPRSSRSLQGRAWHKGHAMGSLQHEVEKGGLAVVEWPVHHPSSKTLVEFYTSPSLPDKCYGIMPICFLRPHRALMVLPCCLPLSSPPCVGLFCTNMWLKILHRSMLCYHVVGPAPGDGHYQRKNAKPRQKNHLARALSVIQGIQGSHGSHGSQR